MITFDHEVTIERPVDRVFAYATRLENYRRWQPAIEEIVQTSPGPLGPGSRLRLSVRGPAGPVSADGIVSEFEPNRVIALRSTSGPLPLTARVTFEPLGSATRVHLHTELEPGGMLRFAAGMIRREGERALPRAAAELKAQIEAESP